MFMIAIYSLGDDFVYLYVLIGILASEQKS